MKILLAIVAFIMTITIISLIMQLLFFPMKETLPSENAIRKNNEFIERQAQKEVDTLEHFFGFEDEK